MSDDVHVSISQDSIKKIIETKVQLAVMEALSPNAELFMKTLVESVLLQESREDRDRYAKVKPTFLGTVIREMIEKETRAAVIAWAADHKELISKKVRDSIGRKGVAGNLADQLLKNLIECSAYSFKIELQTRER